MANPGKGPKALTSAKSIVEAQRRSEILRLRLDGMTLSQIGEKMGVGADAVHGVIDRALTAMCKPATEELLAAELERCDELLDTAMQTVRAFHPLVSAGRVVIAPVLDATGQQVLDEATGIALTGPLEDKAPRLAAIATAVRVMERRAKLAGLDAPVRAQQEVTYIDGNQAGEFIGFDDNDLSLYEYLIEKRSRGVSEPARDVQREMQQTLNPDEVAILQSVFQRLGVRYLAADVVVGLYGTTPRLSYDAHAEIAP